MTTAELADALAMLIADDRDEIAPVNVRTYADHGMLSNNDGVVIELADGSEYQLTIVDSTRR